MKLGSFSILLAAGLLALSGCGPAKLDVTKSYTLDGMPQIVLLDPQPKAQKITVEFEAPSEVTVLLMKRADCPEGEEGFVPVAKAIAHKKEASGAVTGDLPANTEGMVIVRGGNKLDVKIHVTNQK